MTDKQREVQILDSEMQDVHLGADDGQHGLVHTPSAPRLIEKTPQVLNPMAEWPWITQGATVNEDSNTAQVSREMPRYKCHKEVWALKIAAIEMAPADQEKMHEGGDWQITPADVGYGRILVGHDFITKHKPQVGGYYVVYDDGYKSYSPAKPFEDGYSLAEPNALELGAAVRAAGMAGS